MNKLASSFVLLLIAASAVFSAPIIQGLGVPNDIAVTANVTYWYDPSEYVFLPNGTYQLNGTDVGGLKSLGAFTSPSAKPQSFRMPENQFGVWDLTKPAVFLYNNMTITWSFLANPTSVYAYTAGNIFKLTNSTAYVCQDVVALSPSVIAVDCVSKSTNTLFVVTISGKTKTVYLVNSTTSYTPFNQSLPRRLVSYKFGDSTFIYRYDPLAATYIDVFDATDLTAIKFATTINATSLGYANFSPVSLSIYNGLLFVANKKAPEIAMLTYTDVSNQKFSVSTFNVGDFPWAVRAYSDIGSTGQSLSVLVSTVSGLYRVDWTNPNSPFVAEAYSLGSVYPTTNNVSSMVFGTQSFYYVMMRDLNVSAGSLLVFMRKGESAFLYQALQNIPSIPTMLNVHIGEDIVSTLTQAKDAVLTVWQNSRPVYPVNISGDLSLPIAIKSGNTVYQVTSQSFLIGQNNSGIYYTQNFNYTLGLPSSNSLRNISFGWIRSFEEPTNLTVDGSTILNFTSLGRVFNLSFSLPPSSQEADFVQVNPFYPNIFNQLSQPVNKLETVNINQCSVDGLYPQSPSVVCSAIQSLGGISTTITKATFLYSPITQNISLVAIVTSDKADTVQIYNATTGNVAHIITDTQCSTLQQSLYDQSSYIFCTTQDKIVAFYLDQTDSLVQVNIDNAALGLETFAPVSVVTSPKYNNIVFIREVNRIIIANIGFIGSKIFEVLSTITMYGTTNNFAVAGDKLIVVYEPNYLYYYSLKNLRKPGSITFNQTMPYTLTASSLSSTGSHFFTLTYNNTNTAFFDSFLPNAGEPYKVAFAQNVLASLKFGHSQIVISQDKTNTQAAVQLAYSNIFTVNVTNSSADSETDGMGTFLLPNTYEIPYGTNVLLINGSAVPISLNTTSNVKLNLSSTAKEKKPFSYRGYVSYFFNGNLNATFNATAQRANETQYFTLGYPHTNTSTQLGLDTNNVFGGSTSTDSNKNTRLTLSYFNSTSNVPQIVNFGINSTGQVVNSTSINVALPTDDATNYRCSQFFNTFNTTQINVLICNYLNNDTNYLILQSMDGKTTGYTVINSVNILSVVISTNLNYVYVLIGQGNNEILLAYSTQNAVPVLVSTTILEHVFNAPWANFVDFDYAPLVAGTTDRILALDSKYGVRSFDIKAAAVHPVTFNFVSAPFFGSLAFANQFISDEAEWLTLDILSCPSAITCQVLLVQQYGPSFLVQWNVSNGLDQLLTTYSQYYDWANIDVYSVNQNFIYLLAAAPGTKNYTILAYPAGSGAAALDQTQQTVATFNYEPTVIYNNNKNPNSALVATDYSGNFVQALYTGEFLINFTGNATQMNSTYVLLNAYGGSNTIATANISLILQLPPGPTPDPNPTPGNSNLGLIAAVAAGVIIVLVVAIFLSRRKKQREQAENGVSFAEYGKLADTSDLA